MAFVVAVLEALREERLERRRHRRYLRENYLERAVFPDIAFIASYRLSRELFEQLCQDIVPLMRPRRNRRGMEPVTKVGTHFFNFYNIYVKTIVKTPTSHNLYLPCTY